MTTIIRWLHLTDLHVGMDNQDWLLPGILGKFCEDLEAIRPTVGPWDLVLFSGDLVQKGTEYAQLEDIFGKIWDCFRQLDCDPKLLAVPGNHDLQWCKAKHPVVKMLHRWSADPDVAEEFWKDWKDPNGSYRQVIKQAFAAYEAWWQGTTRKPDGIQSGLLPGDFSCTFTKDGVRLGIVGLNSAFLQLTEKKPRHAYKGKLVVDPRQFQTVCGGDGVEWAKSHDACFLMTHHPPEWLTTDSCDHLNGEILERFCLHMCGHNHETHVLQQLAGGGTEAPVRWLGRSLFGLEKPRSGKLDRSHGYVAGELHFTDDGGGHLQFTPRRRAVQSGPSRFVPDHDGVELPDDRRTRTFPVLRRQANSLPTLSTRDYSTISRYTDNYVERDVRLDIAGPRQVYVGETFEIAACITGVENPKLKIKGKPKVTSADGKAFAPQSVPESAVEEESADYAIHLCVDDRMDFSVIGPTSHPLKWMPGKSPRPVTFSLRPLREGKLYIRVDAIQEIGGVIAQNSITVVAKFEVVAPPSGKEAESALSLSDNADHLNLRTSSSPFACNASYDVFLSHNSEDKPMVRDLRDALQACGLSTWFDEDQLIPGRPWQEALEEAIEPIGAALVCVGASGLGPWQNQEMRACIDQFVRNGAAVIPVLLPGAVETPELPIFLRRFTWVNLQDGLSDDGLHRLFCGIRGTAPGETAPVGHPTLRPRPAVGERQLAAIGGGDDVLDQADPEQVLPRVAHFLRDLPESRRELYEQIVTALCQELPELQKTKREGERTDLMEVVRSKGINAVLEALYRWLDRPSRPRISVDGWQEVLTHLVVLAAARPVWLRQARRQEKNGGLVSAGKKLEPLSAAVLISGLFDVAIRVEGSKPTGHISMSQGRGSRGYAVEDRFQDLKQFLQNEYKKYLSPETESLDEHDLAEMLLSDRGQNNPRFLCLPSDDALAGTISKRLDGLLTVLQENETSPRVLDESFRLVKNMRDLLDKLQRTP